MRTRILAIAACVALLASCSKEDNPGGTVNGPDEGRTAIVPTAGVSMSATSRAALPSGPIRGTTFPASTENVFAVTAYKGTTAPLSDYSSAYFNNEAVDSGADRKLGFQNVQYYPADAGKLYFYAYSPVCTATSGDSKGYTAGTTSTEPTVTWTIDGQQDIMWASVTEGIGKVSAGTSQPQPKFQFRHLLKQVRFKLVQGEGFGDGINATSVKITDCRTQASLNLITGELTFSDDASQSLELSGSNTIKPEAQAEEIGSILCQAGETKLSIEVQAAGITYQTTVNLTSDDDTVTAGAAGVSHLVTLTFKGTQIVPEATIIDWKEAGVTTGEFK